MFKITSKDLYYYFCQRTEEENCPKNNFQKDLFLIKRLLTKYSPYSILEGVDKYLGKDNPKGIGHFYIWFPSSFIAKQDKINKYIRFFPFFSLSIQSQISSLIMEYRDYLFAEIVADDEIRRKLKIEKELEELTKDYFLQNKIENPQNHLFII